MNENSKYIDISRDLRPSYYDSFQCLAGACRNTCCKGWTITFNKKDYLSLKRLNGSDELNEKLASCLHRIHKVNKKEDQYAEFKIGTEACPLQREDGMCMLQIEQGVNALPNVCQVFPRSQYYLPSGYLERTLSLACESVLLQLWNLPQGIDFCSDPLDAREAHHAFRRPSSPLLQHFQDIRSWCIDILQNRNFPLTERIFRMGVALEKLPEYKNKVNEWINVVCPSVTACPGLLMDISNPDRKLLLFLNNNIRQLFCTLEPTNTCLRDWQAELGVVFQISLGVNGTMKTSVSSSIWKNAEKRYHEAFKNIDYFMENLMVALFFHLHMPFLDDEEILWKSYVDFCILYSIYHFMMVMSCHEGAEASRDRLFEVITMISRVFLHNNHRLKTMRDDYFANDTATLAHMAVLLSD